MRQRLRPSSRRCAKATARVCSLRCFADLSERKLTIRVLPSGSMLLHMHHSSSSLRETLVCINKTAMRHKRGECNRSDRNFKATQTVI